MTGPRGGLTQSLNSRVTGIFSLSEAPITFTDHTHAHSLLLRSHGHRHEPHLTRLLSLRILPPPLISGMKEFTLLTGEGKKKSWRLQKLVRSTQLFTAIFTTLLRNTLLCAVLLSTPSVVCCSSASNFPVVLCLSCGITSETRLQISAWCSSAFSFS